MTASRTISQLLKAERMSDIIGCIDFARSTSVRVRTSYIHDTQMRTYIYTLYTVPSLNMISFRSCILSAALLASPLPNMSAVSKPSLRSGTRSASSTIPSAPRVVVKTWSRRLRNRSNLRPISPATTRRLRGLTVLKPALPSLHPLHPCPHLHPSVWIVEVD